MKAEVIANEIFHDFDAKDAAAYVTLGNVYAAAGLHEKASALRSLMEKRNIKKTPGISWTVDSVGKWHTFYANDRSHPKIKEIDAKWQQLAELIEYKPDVRWVLQNVSKEQKHLHLCKHSEKLALCFALITMPALAAIRIVKNLRMCGDCHQATALISKLVGRCIIVRDAKVEHRFEDGLCSCGGRY
jgi:hypothetical protein